MYNDGDYLLSYCPAYSDVQIKYGVLMLDSSFLVRYEVSYNFDSKRRIKNNILRAMSQNMCT